MSRRGRPLRFLGMALGGWTMLRAGMLWPTLEAAHDLIRAIVDPPAVAAKATVPHAGPAAPARHAAAAPRFPIPAAPGLAPPGPPPRDPVRIALAAASFLSFGRAVPVAQAGAIPPPLRPTPVDPTRRLTGSAWGIVREGQASGLAGGQLGGSQAGLRIAYALGDARRVALTARVSTPLEGRGAEAALGAELRIAPSLRVIAERRVGLDGGPAGTALYAVGGIAPLPIAAGFRLEGYAQGGMVVRGRTLGFADGAARLTRAVSRTLDLGVGAWGGVQPGAARIDLGPTVGVALPVAGRAVRLSIDWRERVAGQARPGSGPALSIGSDF